MSAVLDRFATTLAPLGLFSIFGTNLARLTADLEGSNALPETPGGVAVEVGGKRARLLHVAQTQINGQLREDHETGSQQLTVNNGSGVSPAVTVTVAPAAPAIFFSSTGSAIVKNADFSMVRPGNPARAGDALLIFFTGGGQTNPPIAGGLVVGFPPLAETAPVRVTIGAQTAEILYSAASPGFVGLYQGGGANAVRGLAGLCAGDTEHRWGDLEYRHDRRAIAKVEVQPGKHEAPLDLGSPETVVSNNLSACWQGLPAAPCHRKMPLLYAIVETGATH